MSSFTILALCIAVLSISGSASQDNEVCLTLPRSSIPTNQGTPGKRGPIGATGPRGSQGQKGEPGDLESCGCNPGDIAELKEQVRALLGSCFGGLIYNNQCIRLAYEQGPGVYFTKAEQVCSNLNATLAEITSDEMFNVVYEYVKTHWVKYTEWNWKYVFVWLGSSFEPISNPNNLITLRNGTKVRLGNWYPGFPYKGSSYSVWKGLRMFVRSSDDSSYRGFRNIEPTNTSPVPLCATQLPNQL